MSYRMMVFACACALSCAATQAGVYVDLIGDLDPMHWYRLGESPGATVAVDSAGDLDGAYHNVLLGQEGAVFNDPDTAGGFFPSWVEAPHDPSLLLDHGSLGFGFQDINSVHWAGLISKDSEGFDTGGHLSLLTVPNPGFQTGMVTARLQSDIASYVLSGPTYGLNTWHHVVFTWGAEGIHLFFDGVLVDSHAYTGGLAGNFEPLVFGAAQTRSADLSSAVLTGFFSGLLDEVMLFDYQLDADDVAAIFAAQRGEEQSNIPEPASLAMLLGGALWMLRRRRA